MIKHLFYISLFVSITSYAQVGIGTDLPLGTLHVKENRDATNNKNDVNSNDGILIPKISKSKLALKQTTAYNTTSNEGLIVYVNNISGTITGPSTEMVDQINSIGFYYLSSDNKWIPIAKKGLDKSNDAWINNPTMKRVELATTSKGITRPNGSEVVITDNGNVGINITNPTKRLEVNLANGENESDALRVSNLKTENFTNRSLVIDSQGFVGIKLDDNNAGKIQRFPIKKIETISAGETKSLLIDTDPNSASNSINTITPPFIPQSTNTGIVLPAGIYRLEVKIVGYFNSADVRNSVEVKTLVNGLEYSSQDYGSNTDLNNNGSNFNGFTVMDLIELKEQAEIDFVIKNNVNSFTVVDYINDTNNRIYGSLILIQRLK